MFSQALGRRYSENLTATGNLPSSTTGAVGRRPSILFPGVLSSVLWPLNTPTESHSVATLRNRACTWEKQAGKLANDMEDSDQANTEKPHHRIHARWEGEAKGEDIMMFVQDP